MEALTNELSSGCHAVAIAHPGRGHINPMMNLCKLIVSRRPDILVTFVVTEEWHGFVGSDPKPDNIRFGCIPNVIPSELGRAADFPGFIEAVMTKMEAPFERLLDRLEPAVTLIIADTHLSWVVKVGNRRNIPVASLWPMSASVFSVLYYFDLLAKKGHFPVDLSERGEERVDYVPGISPTRMIDLPTVFHGNGRKVLHRVLDAMSSWMPKSQYLLLTSVYELEPEVIDALKTELRLPIYPVGPLIPYFKLDQSNSPASTTVDDDLKIFQWLDSQPSDTVLYVSLGSFLSVSAGQMDEIAAGLRESGVPYLWVVRGETSRFKDGCGDSGLMVPWCDQLKVLCHSSVGGFWTHCGWNSTLEGAFAGVPMLTCPIFWDQPPNSKLIVEDWKSGRRVKSAAENLVRGEEIALLVRRFMDLGSDEGKEMRRRARALREICGGAIGKGGSSESSINAFIRDITKFHGHEADF